MDYEVQSWLDTPAAAIRQLAGLPLPSEAELRFLGELDERESALSAFNEAHRPAEAQPPRTVYQQQQELAASRVPPGSDWISIREGEETLILKRLRALAESARIARESVSYGPGEANPAFTAAMERVTRGVA